MSTLQLAAASPFLDSMAANMAVPVITGAEFFECAYWPIGGLATLARSHSTAEHGRELSRKKTLSNSLEMMRSLHVAHERLLESDRSELSLGKAAYVVQSVLKRGQGVAADQLERHWQFYKNRIALLYAANSLKIDDDRTLLEEMERYYPRLELCEEHLLTWLGMASFALAVLDRCPVNWDDFSNPVSLSSLNGRRIPSGVTPVPFSPEHDYSTSQVEQIIETFQKKKRGRPRKRNS
ncbi:hypothetical protein [Rhizobium wenxiniae]|uniref:hypothetical protein n=1 Tax=Rhizobium wenxiniae TaxID=1737357 RepID=UPI001C6EA8C1|nr:hypothetical protein [Rhizobium wenxiniae]